MRIATSTVQRRSVGRPRRVTLEQVVDAACEMGLGEVDMATLAQKLGIGVATLYGYVTDRNHLLRLVGDRLAERWSIIDTGQSWEDALREHAWLSFEVYRDNPKLIPQLMAGLLGGLADSPHTDALLRILIGRGMTAAQASQLYLDCTQLLIGAAVGAAYAASLQTVAGGSEALVQQTRTKCEENGFDALDACLASTDLFAVAGDFRGALERLISEYQPWRGVDRAQRRAATAR